MKFELSENEMYAITRQIANIRTKIQLLESEFTYMPLHEAVDILKNIDKYTRQTTILRNMCSEVLSLINGSRKGDDLFSGRNQNV